MMAKVMKAIDIDLYNKLMDIYRKTQIQLTKPTESPKIEVNPSDVPHETKDKETSIICVTNLLEQKPPTEMMEKQLDLITLPGWRSLSQD